MTQNGFLRCRQMFFVTLLGCLISSVSFSDTLELIRKIPHSGYSEGLDFYDGYLWNPIKDKILQIDPKDGSVLNKWSPPTEHSESVAWFNHKMFNLSFSDNGIYVGDLTQQGILNFQRKGNTPEIHGWGLTHNGKELIMTGNFSSKIYFVSPKSLKVLRTLETPAKDIEDLAWDGEFIWASSFTTEAGKIFAIHPNTGKVLGTYALPDDNCPVIDGIAYDGKNLWVTGKECPSLYYIKKPTVRSLTSKK